jgi:hypothetical protein
LDRWAECQSSADAVGSKFVGCAGCSVLVVIDAMEV